jgi:hypothetical protein
MVGRTVKRQVFLLKLVLGNQTNIIEQIGNSGGGQLPILY